VNDGHTLTGYSISCQVRILIFQLGLFPCVNALEQLEDALLKMAYHQPALTDHVGQLLRRDGGAKRPPKRDFEAANKALVREMEAIVSSRREVEPPERFVLPAFANVESKLKSAGAMDAPKALASAREAPRTARTPAEGTVRAPLMPTTDFRAPPTSTTCPPPSSSTRTVCSQRGRGAEACCTSRDRHSAPCSARIPRSHP
jgi:hypothetical protein